MSMAWEVTEQDVANVLRSNWADVGNTNGRTFEVMAADLFFDLDFDLIEDAALAGNDMGDQVDCANGEILRQLREQGVIEGLAPEEVVAEVQGGG